MIVETRNFYFILEVGKGVLFVGRQEKIVVGSKTFYADLVFYHRILRCFVIFEIKVGEFSPKDIGQLQFYVNYYDRQEKSDEERPTVGILLCANKDDTVVEFALPEKSKNLFAAEYKLYLPEKEELEKRVREVLG